MKKNYIEYHTIENKPKDLIVLILPGGGYEYTSLRESIPVAKMINQFGYHAGIYYYRQELLKGHDLLKEGFSFIDDLLGQGYKKIVLLGFSAGGHLAGMLTNMAPVWIDGLALAYPVVSMDHVLMHAGSFERFLNESDNPDDFSLEKVINQKFPPTFIWHTQNDQSVVVENSLALVNTLHKNNTEVEFHLFPKGRHGLSIITAETAFNEDVKGYLEENQDVKIWTKLLESWLKNI